MNTAMAKVISFEELNCWQLSKELAVDIYKLSSKGELGKDFCLREQLRKSAISIVSNIAEGKERGGPSDFIRFLLIAKASAAELRAQLIIAKEIYSLDEMDFQRLLERMITVSSMIASLIKSIRRRKE